MSELKKDNQQIYITKEAFRNMITHVLRFGHKSLAPSHEVLGFCLGKQDETGNIRIINAIPVSHGHDIQIGISQSYLDLIKKIEESYKEQHLEVIGWYISHPSNGLDWSEQDKKNHLYIQNNKKPKAFCIVFDHTLVKMVNNFGLKIYRLFDYKKGDINKYENIGFEIEEPKTLDYFKWIQKFVEDFHKKDPILIKEIEEVSETIPKDLQQIPISVEDESETDLESLDNIQNSSSEFLNNINSLIKEDIMNWMKDINHNTINGSNKLLKTLIEMKESVSLGMSRMKNWFNQEIGDLSSSFKESITNLVDKSIEDQKELTNSVNNKQQRLIEIIIEIINSQFKDNNDLLEKKYGEINENINKLKENQIINKEEFQKIKNILPDLRNDLDKSSDNIIKNFKDTIDKKNAEKRNQMKILDAEINKIEQIYLQMDQRLKELENGIISVRKI
ncbi:MAG: hypothetical protein KGD57_03730 [Candidatus Lokiarchaeota archaeon]|nr:hypothetical protein [Candidatus Lokiarchaeota archaeon]